MGQVSSHHFDDLPLSLNAAFGEYLTYYSQLESRIQNLIYCLVGDRSVAQQVMETKMHSRDLLIFVEGLVHAKTAQLTAEFRELKKILREASTHRNRIVHGKWIQYSTNYNDERWLRVPINVATSEFAVADRKAPIWQQAYSKERLIGQRDKILGIMMKIDDFIRKASLTTGVHDSSFTFRV